MTKETKDNYHHGDLKNGLIEAARCLLKEKGIDKLSLREVAKRAGVSHTAPYRHFKSKTALLQTIADEGFLELAESMRKVQKRYAKDPAKQLIEAGCAYVQMAVEHPEQAHLMFGGVLECDKDDDDPQNVGRQSFNELLTIVENGQKAGIYKKRETLELAVTAWSLVHGISMLIIAGELNEVRESGISIKQLTQMMCQLLHEGLLK